MKTIKFKDIQGNICLIAIASIAYMQENSLKKIVTAERYERDEAQIFFGTAKGPEYKYKLVQDAIYETVYSTLILLGNNSCLTFPGRVAELEELIKDA